MGAIKLTFLVFGISCCISCDNSELRGYVTSYVNVNERFEQSEEWNMLNGYSEINISQDTYSIYAMGDSHVGGTLNLDAFFKVGIDSNAAAMLLVGDIVTGHKEDYTILSEHLPEKDSLDYFAVVGNHDLYFDGWQYFYEIFGSSTYYFVVNTPNNSDLFICLDTGGGTLGDKQLSWFKKLLETNRKKYRYCLVFSHVNLFRLRPTLSTNPMVEELQVLSDLFLRHRVTMVVNGHDHKQNSAVLGNTTYLIMDALQDTYKSAGYLSLNIQKQTIDYTFVKL